MAPPRILFLCTASPFGTSGSGVRTLHLARLMARLGHLRLVVATGRDWTPAQLAQTRAEFDLADYFTYKIAPIGGPINRFRQIFDSRFLNTNGVCVPPDHASRLQSLLDDSDVVWIHTQKLANAFRRFHWPRTIIDVDDYPSRFHASAIPHSPWLLPKLRRIRNAYAWRRREAVWAERFSILTVCKEADRAHFGAGPRVHVVPNGFAPPPHEHPRQPSANAPRLGMIGDFTYLPNHNGLRWFVAECWPEVRRRFPAATLHLIGKASDELARTLAVPGLIGHGYVPDTGIEIATWSAMIVPTRLGGGTHLKVAEGLARRVPLVTTSHGTRGYAIEPGRHALVADTGTDFAAGCVQLLGNAAAGDRLAAAGWDLFVAKYSWDSIQPAVAAAIQHCLEFSGSVSSPSSS
jgi:glycosyltransferase involved in cell wall biosynthesis